ncbi:hypothetical protein, partial [Treponema saccharophilum]|uniref:hypothetical protein n=1 Tax=Treponema saccharophilum TaxID=165 RepID=UPI00386D8211
MKKKKKRKAAPHITRSPAKAQNMPRMFLRALAPRTLNSERKKETQSRTPHHAQPHQGAEHAPHVPACAC